MKKLVSLLLAVCTCLSVGVTLTACEEEHAHTYETEWAHDDTHHWHECEGENCAEVSDKAEHAWNDGEITTEATAEADGVKTFTCTACGQTKTESVAYVPTEAEIWQNAFDNSLLTNYTIRFVSEGETSVYKCTITEDNHIVYFYASGEEGYLVKTSDKYIMYEKENNAWSKTEMNANEVPANMKVRFDNWYLSYTLMCPNFSNFYDSFEYNNSEQIYVFEGSEDSEEIQTNSIMEDWSAEYYYATVKLVDRKINHICVKMSGQDGRVDNIYFENYGTTTIELPTVSE